MKMIWKKATTANKLSVNKLIKTIYEHLSIEKQSVAICDMHNSNLLKIKESICISGVIVTDSLDSLNTLLGVCECDNPENFMTVEKMAKVCERLRQAFKSDYSLFISHEFKGQIGICVQSKIRTYVTTLETSEYSKKTVRYKALYELAKIVYNEANQSVPIKERKIVF